MGKVRLAGIEYNSVVDGPGIRLVFFVQGCPFRCAGCHNSATQKFSGGKLYDIDDILKIIAEQQHIDGITFSGGEPFFQAPALAVLGEKIKETGANIVTYSGFTFEEILCKTKSNQDWRRLLKVTDILIDGPFEQERKNLSLPFRGSDNQRLVDVSLSLNSGRVVFFTSYWEGRDTTFLKEKYVPH